MTLIPLLAVLAIVMWVVDRLLLAFERRGWISYRRMLRVRHAYGDAALGIDALLQPGKRHVIEMQQAAEEYKESDDEAEKLRRRLEAPHGDTTRRH